MRLSAGRLPLNAAEHDAVERLLAKYPDANATLTRRDPGETGPVLAHIGDYSFQIGANGRTKKVN